MPENKDTLEAERPLCKLKLHKLSKDIGDTGLRDNQEVNLKGFGDYQYNGLREREKK